MGAGRKIHMILHNICDEMSKRQPNPDIHTSLPEKETLEGWIYNTIT